MNPLLFPAIDKLLDIVSGYFPNDEAKQKAKLALLEAEKRGDLEETKTQLSAIIAEAQSSDPYTSRARPSFLYVVYICILFGLPMGILSAFKPDTAAAVAVGFQKWLAAIPSELYTLFGVGYLGYTGSRTWEKVRGVNK